MMNYAGRVARAIKGRAGLAAKAVPLSSLLLLAIAFPGIAAPGNSSSSAEAGKGRAIYAQHCASCHGSQLEGQGAPDLAGPNFASRWLRGDRRLGDLAHAIEAMPRDAPGSLPKADYDALLAYVLSANGLATSPAADPRTALSASRATSVTATPPAAAEPLPAKPQHVEQAQSAAPTDAELLHPSPGDWLMYNRTYAGDRYSPLDQINASNVSHLAPVCVLSLGVLGSFQGSPLIYHGMGFISSTYEVDAFDATSCQRKWSYTYTPNGPEGIRTSRGLGLYDGKLFRGTPDGHLIALDMMSGKLLWDAHVADSRQSYSIGAAPIAFNGRVIVGLAGGDYGNSGRVFAFDAKTGERLWSFATIDRKSWPKGAEYGGGGTWTTVAVDPERNLVFVPIGNPAPDYYLPARPGSNLYTNSVVALDAASGKVAWYVQQLDRDYHDWDTSAAPILYEQDGHRYMAVGTKAGYLYIYDRDTHRLVSRTSVLPRANDTLPFTSQPIHVCPGTNGGVEWNGPGYDPKTKSIFVNTVHWCATWWARAPEGKRPGSWYVEANITMDPPEQTRGWTYALDAGTGKVIWSREAPKPMIGAITPTAGGIVLTGGGDGMFLALDPRSGRELYRFNTGGAIGGGIASFMVDGRQYVAVASGGYGLSSFGVVGAPAVLVFALPAGMK